MKNGLEEIYVLWMFILLKSKINIVFSRSMLYFFVLNLLQKVLAFLKYSHIFTWKGTPKKYFFFFRFSCKKYCSIKSIMYIEKNSVFWLDWNLIEKNSVFWFDWNLVKPTITKIWVHYLVRAYIFALWLFRFRRKRIKDANVSLFNV